MDIIKLWMRNGDAVRQASSWASLSTSIRQVKS